MQPRGATPASRHLFAIAALTGLLALAGCNATTGPGGPGPGTQAPQSTTNEFVEPTAPPVGHWTGTITLRGVISVDKTEPGHSDLDPSNTYYETWVKNDLTQTDVTDTFTITGVDHEATYGLVEADLGGSAANAGSTDERDVTTYDKSNSGCTWTEEDGTETKGSWTGSGKAAGTLHFSNDGSYWIEIHPDITLPTGYEPDGPQLPYRNWQTDTNLSAGCEGQGYDTTTTQGPVIWWVSSWLGSPDVNGNQSEISGHLNAASPGSVVDGTVTWKLKEQALTMTITWHLGARRTDRPAAELTRDEALD